MRHFGLSTLRTGAGGSLAALALDKGFWPLHDGDLPCRPLDVKNILAHWRAVFPLLEQIAATYRVRPDYSARFISQRDALIDVPIRFPNKLIAVGANYKDHLVEAGRSPEKWPTLPFFFKPPSTTMVGPGKTVRKPKTTQQFDWEVELAVIIGETLREVDLATAKAGIAGYTVGIDLSCRDLTRAGGALGMDLARGKAQDTMAPVGPAIIPAAFVPSPQSLGLRLYVNGTMRQDGSTSNMLYSIEEQLSVISQFVTLEPGDVIFTGTPAGTGMASGRYLNEGDQLRAEIEGVGCLEVQVEG
jgi:2-keto-4-pentenoate hydratase/2-oxohepta-3-ene-1,7-dioic acid hydratase in catechol pathway